MFTGMLVIVAQMERIIFGICVERDEGSVQMKSKPIFVQVEWRPKNYLKSILE